MIKFKGTTLPPKPTKPTTSPQTSLIGILRAAQTDQERAQIIEKNLLSTRDKKLMADIDITVLQILEGLYTKPEQRDIGSMFESWNADLGEEYFKLQYAINCKVPR